MNMTLWKHFEIPLSTDLSSQRNRSYPQACLVLMFPKDTRTLRLLFLRGINRDRRADVLTDCHDQLRRPRWSDGPVFGGRSLKGAPQV
jgi:hypothetical protein